MFRVEIQMRRNALSIRMSRAAAGFTILELLVTITLAAVILALAIPSFGQMMATSRLTTQTNDFVAAVNFARSEAITRNVNIFFCRVATTASDDCALSSAAWEHWIVRTSTAPGTVIRRGSVATTGGLGVSSDLTNDLITFGSDGLSRTGGDLVSASQINVCSSVAGGDNIRRVTVGAGSRISTEKVAGAC